MLLNLSNHPSKNWTQAQRDAAEQTYGSIGELAFPSIEPTATTDEVKKLARNYAKEILATPRITAVHLMGEMTFVVALVRLLQKSKMVVVCSTTKRTVVEEKNGLKTAQFNFVQFRTYP